MEPAAYKTAVAALVPFAAGTALAVGPVGSVGVAVVVVAAAAGQTSHFAAAFVAPLDIRSAAVDTASYKLDKTLCFYDVHRIVSAPMAVISAVQDVHRQWQLV